MFKLSDSEEILVVLAPCLAAYSLFSMHWDLCYGYDRRSGRIILSLVGVDGLI